jgi:hypothetical protein
MSTMHEATKSQFYWSHLFTVFTSEG